MKKLLILLLVTPSLLFSALPQKGIPEPVEGNPFELLKEIIERNTSKGSRSDTNKPEETAQTKETTKLVFPSDIEGVEEIYEDPKLTEFGIYGDTKLYYLKNGKYLSSYDFLSHFNQISPDSNIFDIEKSCSGSVTTASHGNTDTASGITKQCGSRWTATGIEKVCSTYKTGGGYDPAEDEDEINKEIVKQPIQTTEDEINKEIVKQPIQSTKDYKTNTLYRFITKIDKNIIFAKDSEQLDRKLDPKLNGLGELTINLESSYSAKKYFETPVYVTLSAYANSAYANNSCVMRSIISYWYDPNELKIVKEEPESKIQNTEEDKITPVDDIAITFDGIDDSYYDGYNLHERMIESSLNNSEIKIYCSSCTEQKDYSVKVDIDSYKKRHAENVKKQEKIKFDQSVAPLKSQCEEIGFIPGTDKFKNCLVEMMN